MAKRGKPHTEPAPGKFAAAGFKPFRHGSITPEQLTALGFTRINQVLWVHQEDHVNNTLYVSINGTSARLHHATRARGYGPAHMDVRNTDSEILPSQLVTWLLTKELP